MFEDLSVRSSDFFKEYLRSFTRRDQLIVVKPEDFINSNSELEAQIPQVHNFTTELSDWNDEIVPTLEQEKNIINRMNDNYQEEVEEQEKVLTIEEKYEKMREVLAEALANSDKKIGVVKSGPDEKGFFRVSIGGSETIHSIHPEMNLRDIKVGSEVVICTHIIEFVLPEELTLELEKLDFDRVNWEDIRGLDSQIADIREAVEGPIQNSELYHEFGLEASKGLLLYGPSGTGKTMLAKAIATSIIGEEELAAESFVYMKGGEMLSKWVGEAEGNIKNIFKKCRDYTQRTGNKSIIFIDEAEALLPERGSRRSSDVDTTIVPTFLAEMDGLNNNNPFVILATNHGGQLDKAIVRPGRIDLRVEVKRPNEQDALAILDLYYSKTKCAATIGELCAETLKHVYQDQTLAASISGALLKNMVQRSSLEAIKRLQREPRGVRGITLDDVRQSFTH